MQTFTFEVEPFSGYSESSEALESWEYPPGELQYEKGGGRPQISRMSGARASQFRGTQRGTTASYQRRIGPNIPKRAQGIGGATSHRQMPPSGPQRLPVGQYPPRPAGWPFAFANLGPMPGDGGPAPVAGPAGSEYISWVQDSLNRVLGAQLPVDGVMTPDVRNAVSSFQQQSGLPVSGIVGPDTERALLAAVGGNQPG
jgi:Putative peptidoglycan binding domain